MKCLKLGLAALALVFVAAGAVGCNTVRGAGRDIERGGEAIQEGATQVQQDMRSN
jgi:entericidin B